MSGVLAYNVNSVVATGLYITIISVNTGYTISDEIVVNIVDGGPGGFSYNGTMNKIFAPLGVSTFYSWYDLNGYDIPMEIAPNSPTTIDIYDPVRGGNFEATYSTGTDINQHGYFPWPGAGGGGSAACFTANSQLLTPAGYVAASTLCTGDVLVTADGRQVPIKMYTSVFKADKASAPYLIPKNSLTRNVPASDLRLSPWHAISLGDGLWQKPQTAAEIRPGSVTQYDIGKNVQYYHFEAPNYFTDNFICEGTVVESFSAKQVSGKERPYTWSAKYKAYTRNNKNKNSKKSVGV